METAQQTSEFAIRGLEIHSRRMWQWRAVDSALELMHKLDLNTLIFHQNELTDNLVWPRAFFTTDMMYARWPIRMSNINNDREFVREVVRRAARYGISFYPEVKEIWYPESLLEIHPEVMIARGIVCPTHPFWWEWVRTKYRELLETVPNIGGVIVSPGTRETKVSISAHACPCERCASQDPKEWYSALIRAMYEPLAAAGKRLIVRDFAYTRAEQNLVLDACTAVSPDIIAALKNTPHDFYPTFPDNPRIGHTSPHPAWVEFDTWGEYFGLGLFPTSVVEDMQSRLRHSASKGVQGVWFRTDWECVTDASTFNSLNLLNVFAGGMLSQNPELELSRVYDAWMEHGLLDAMQPESGSDKPIRSAPEDRERWIAFMKASWKVIEKTVFVRGLLFHDGSCMFPDSLERAFDIMLVFHDRDDWEPGASNRVKVNETNIRAILEEKAEAESELEQLPAVLGLDSLQIPESFRASLREMFTLYRSYVRGFRHCTESCFRTKQALLTREEQHRELAAVAVDALSQYRATVLQLLNEHHYPHYVNRLLDTDGLDRLVNDLRCHLATLAPAPLAY